MPPDGEIPMDKSKFRLVALMAQSSDAARQQFECHCVPVRFDVKAGRHTTVVSDFPVAALHLNSAFSSCNDEVTHHG